MRRAALMLAVGAVLLWPCVVVAGPVFGTTWTFEAQLYDDTSHPDGPPPGPWIDDARWAYMTSAKQATYTLSDFTLFDTFGNAAFTKAWIKGTTTYPQVNTADATIHPGGSTTCVVAWQVQGWSDTAQIDYELTKRGGGAGDGIGYQVLQWVDATSTMDVLQSVAILPDPAGSTTGLLHLATPVSDGDYIILVQDAGPGTHASYDRTALEMTITSVPEPMTLSLLGIGLLALARRRRR